MVRILYRLRFASEQRPFDTITLGYILPLFFAILNQNGIKGTGSEEGEEQILLVLEFLSFHTSSCKYYRVMGDVGVRINVPELTFIFSFRLPPSS